MKAIDAELKERLSPAMSRRSERFRFAYELAFAIICGDRTNEIVRIILDGWQDANGTKKSYRVPQSAEKQGADKEQGTGDSAPLHIKGFQGGTHSEFESLLRRAAGVVN
jgi:hypothetical protein